MDIFERATRGAYRYPSFRGDLTTEQLWDLPLTAKSGFCLDEVAKSTSRMLHDVSTESFVSTESNPRKTELENMLEVIKHVIAVKLKENEEARNAATRKQEKEKLLAILDSKQTAKLEGMSEEDILARIGQL